MTIQCTYIKCVNSAKGGDILKIGILFYFLLSSPITPQTYVPNILTIALELEFM